MKREELELYIEGIHIAYAHILDEQQELDKVSKLIFEQHITKAIKGLKLLPFSFSNTWFAFKAKRRLQKLYLEIQKY